jgi:hypothetical protein
MNEWSSERRPVLVRVEGESGMISSSVWIC